MPSPHASVIYVEPNMEPIKDGWAVEDTFERAPRLEDYCIAMNIEVEVCSRDKTNDSSEEMSEVLIMQWSKTTGENGGKDYVNFMGGTKIGNYNYTEKGIKRTPRLNNTYDALTTYYADMYVGDLINYGTTEMVGIKSVNIEYEKSCVPIISIVFTDVRGMSIFQPQELLRDNTYNGIKGISQDNVAQSFFQCFFKMPIPKFTIYIKGFYGKPVAYEVMCDKFDTNFNSDTGDFEISTRFIGYAYSFLTDVSMDALIAAPYSDYEGKDYWNNAVKEGRFYTIDKNGAHRDMPTLCEIVTNYDELVITGRPEDEATTVDYENSDHDIELEELKSIREEGYQKWYDNLYLSLSTLFNKENEQRCFDFRDVGTNPDYRYILLLADVHADANLGRLYQEGLANFHELNENVYNTIKTYNEKEDKFKELNNVSLDFTDYRKIRIFNTINLVESSSVENGVAKKIIDQEAPYFYDTFPEALRTEVKNRLFNYYEKDEEGNISSESNYEMTRKTIYQKGKEDKQLLYCYIIRVDYSAITDRINGLNAEANKSEEEKNAERRAKILNEKMMAKMNFYPSIENFTRVMIAHLETFMHIMYTVAGKIREEKRTLASLGITGGEDGNVQDVNDNSKYIPPFPRITEKVFGDDGIVRSEDSWVGKYNDGEGFREVDVINGLFNGIEEIFNILKQSEALQVDNSTTVKPKTGECMVPHPITSYDFFLTSSPYGDDLETLNDINSFIGRVAIRMFDILSISSLRRGGIITSSDVERIAKIEAVNFKKTTTLTNDTLLKTIGVSESSSPLTADMINKLLFANESDYGKIPWIISNEDRRVFSSRGDNNIWMDMYSSISTGDKNDKQWYYPIQGGTFETLNNDFKMFIKEGSANINKSSAEVTNFAIRKAKLSNSIFHTLIDSKNTSMFNNVFFSDDFNVVSGILDKSASDDSNEDYTTILGKLVECATVPSDDNINPILADGVLKRKSYSEPINDYYRNAAEQTVGDACITEFRGIIRNENGVWSLSDTSSLFFEPGLNVSIYRDIRDRCAFAIEAVDAIDYSVIREYITKPANKSGVFMYLPKLAVLQIGAAIYKYCTGAGNNANTWGNYNSDFGTKGGKSNITHFIPLSVSAKANIIAILESMSPLTRVAYAKYFVDWVNSPKGSKFDELLGKLKNNGKQPSNVYSATIDNKKGVLAEDNDLVKIVTHDILSLTLVTRGTVNYDNDVNATTNRVAFEKGWVETYFAAFLDKLRVLYEFKEEDTVDDNGVVRQAKTPAKTTEEMKIELYRYLKLLYDKWIPSNQEASWGLETFFDRDAESRILRKMNGGGHLFHFIDSYYNKIGSKLLLNVGKLAERIRQLLKSNDVNVMMLGFMADIYSDNKCMMLCIQNFLDMSQNDSMMQMFKPIPYNNMPSPNKHPDFVVVYPYEPSKNLDINNGEFKDDGFMLNDEEYTPIAIRSRGDNEGDWYPIPAFGVSYGKQYQNYFKKVNVNMSSPIATQQSIMMKHAILRRSQGDTSKGTQGQDLYDIYSTQSYTCTVEMMGCAWIQPMMYFVLTNVPMFKGSYMIMKVTHSITPGNMTTTFTGCRMSRNSNKLIENVFTDDEDVNSPDYSIDSKKNTLANVDNNCPYKVYNLFESNDIETTGNEDQDAVNIMVKLVSLGAKPELAAGIVGNMAHETRNKPTFNPATLNPNDVGYLSGGLCQFRAGNLKALLTNQPEKYGQIKDKESGFHAGCGRNEEVKRKLKEIGVNGQVEFLIKVLTPPARKKNWIKNGYSLQKFNDESTSAKRAALLFRENFEISDKVDPERWKLAERFYTAYLNRGTNTTTQKSQPEKASDSDIRTEFMRCLQMSVDSTQNGKVQLTSGTSDVNGTTFLKITQENNGRDKLPLVFDIILNGYYDYMQELWWVYDGDGGLKKDPVKISVAVSMKPNDQNRKVYLIDGNNVSKSMDRKFNERTDSEIINESFLRSVRKKYGTGANQELPQFPNPANVLENSTIKNCDDMINEGVNTGVGGELLPSMKIENWDAGKAANFLLKHAHPKYNSKTCGNCAFAVQQAIIAGGVECSEGYGVGGGYRFVMALLNGGHWELVVSGKTDSSVYKSYKPSVGDIMGMTKASKESETGHVCLYCGNGNGWFSDFKQEDAYVYKSHGSGKFWVIRYKGGSRSTSATPQLCYLGKCLRK